MTATQPRIGGIEVRSIDYVPLNERHGKIWHLGPLWFMSNAQIATLAVGLISISEGASLFWSVLAIVIGTLVGTLFMAFHSAQGPQLGLPQMIQSRPQFGYIGALLVWLFAYVQYVGFNVFNTILGGEATVLTQHRCTSDATQTATGPPATGLPADLSFISLRLTRLLADRLSAARAYRNTVLVLARDARDFRSDGR